MTIFDPKKSYKSASGRIIVIQELGDDSLVSTYGAFARRFRVIEQLKSMASDLAWPIYVCRWKEVRDMLKTEIKNRKLKLKDFEQKTQKKRTT